MTKTDQILSIVANSGAGGIKCADIVGRINLSQSSVSGILSQMKKCGLVTNEGAMWRKNDTKTGYKVHDKIIHELYCAQSHIEVAIELQLMEVDR